jgi:hypothetical protein
MATTVGPLFPMIFDAEGINEKYAGPSRRLQTKRRVHGGACSFFLVVSRF